MPVRIIDLPSEDTPTGDDYLLLRDNTTGTTRKLTLNDLFAAMATINPTGIITTNMLQDAAVSRVKLGSDAAGVRTSTQTSPGTLTPDINSYDVFNVTALNTTMTIAAPTGTWRNRQGIMFSIKDNGTSQTLTWNVIFRQVGVTLPAATVSGEMLYVAGRWNAEAAAVDVLSVGRQ